MNGVQRSVTCVITQVLGFPTVPCRSLGHRDDGSAFCLIEFSLVLLQKTSTDLVAPGGTKLVICISFRIGFNYVVNKLRYERYVQELTVAGVKGAKDAFIRMCRCYCTHKHTYIVLQ